jgi:peptidyl serine alpha-galactosyltransferase
MRRRPANVTSPTSAADEARRRKAMKGYGSHDDEHAPIVSHMCVLVIVIVFIALGFMQHAYKKSRSLDPFTGLSLDKFHNKKKSSIAKSSSSSSSGGGGVKRSFLSAAEDESLERDKDGVRYHVVFSTDCSPYQHWQSYLVFFTAMKNRQPGHVTRIASGCDDDEAQAMKDWFEQDVAFLSPKRFHLQLTPHFSQVKNEKGEIVGDYKFFNKPFGLKYWMENSALLQYDAPTDSFPSSVRDDVVVLIDPDMAILRPITADFSNDRETVIGKRRLEHIIARKVGPGQPFAQVYGFGVQWSNLDLAKIAGPDSPAVNVSKTDGALYYPVGPPYLGTVQDVHQISVYWSKFVPGVYEQYPHLLAEMFAFCIAAAHLKLPHQLIDSLMVSEPDAGGEGWPLVDKIPTEDVCKFGRHLDHETHAVPSVLHLCQRYGIGDDWFFSKRAVPSDIYDCETDLFQEPPDNVASLYNYRHMPNGKKTDMTPAEVKRQTFMLCAIYGFINEAAAFYKQAKCSRDSINLNKKRNLAKYMKEHKNQPKATS